MLQATHPTKEAKSDTDPTCNLIHPSTCPLPLPPPPMRLLVHTITCASGTPHCRPMLGPRSSLSIASCITKTMGNHCSFIHLSSLQHEDHEDLAGKPLWGITALRASLTTRAPAPATWAAPTACSRGRRIKIWGSGVLSASDSTRKSSIPAGAPHTCCSCDFIMLELWFLWCSNNDFLWFLWCFPKNVAMLIHMNVANVSNISISNVAIFQESTWCCMQHTPDVACNIIRCCVWTSDVRR